MAEVRERPCRWTILKDSHHFSRSDDILLVLTNQSWLWSEMIWYQFFIRRRVSVVIFHVINEAPLILSGEPCSKAACRRLAYSMSQLMHKLMHTSCDIHASSDSRVKASNGGKLEDKGTHQVKPSAHKCQLDSVHDGNNYTGLFWELYCQWTVELSAKGQQEGKLVTPPPRWVSAQKLYLWVNAQNGARIFIHHC